MSLSPYTRVGFLAPKGKQIRVDYGELLSRAREAVGITGGTDGALLVLDEKLRITLATAEAVDLLGLSPVEAPGAKLKKVVEFESDFDKIQSKTELYGITESGDRMRFLIAPMGDEFAAVLSSAPLETKLVEAPEAVDFTVRIQTLNSPSEAYQLIEDMALAQDPNDVGFFAIELQPGILNVVSYWPNSKPVASSLVFPTSESLAMRTCEIQTVTAKNRAQLASHIRPIDRTLSCIPIYGPHPPALAVTALTGEQREAWLRATHRAILSVFCGQNVSA
ncbi:MAG: PAS domain-containing protein [Armatimonadetes bacterium]|nr:PAS domain-containing protein [Armatimonadota bacterium]